MTTSSDGGFSFTVRPDPYDALIQPGCSGACIYIPDTAYKELVSGICVRIGDVADKRKPRLAWLRDCDFSDVPAPVWEARKQGVDLEEKWRKDMGLEERLCDLRKSFARQADGDEGPRP